MPMIFQVPFFSVGKAEQEFVVQGNLFILILFKSHNGVCLCDIFHYITGKNIKHKNYKQCEVFKIFNQVGAFEPSIMALVYDV